MHRLLRETGFQRPDFLLKISHDVIHAENFDFKSHKANVDTLPGRISASLSGYGVEWMTYNFCTDEEALELYSHYYLAEGDCICTGLGLSIRERWLLNNPKVTSITVLEKNKSVIDFHMKYNEDLCSKINIINISADEYIGSCDTLLLDHYIYPFESIIEDVKKCCSNIACQKMWFWPLEDYIVVNSKPGEYFNFYKSLQKNEFKLLPDLTCDVLYKFISTWESTFITRDRRKNSH